MRVQCTTDSESCVYFIFYFINNTFPVQWSYQNVWIYYLYEIFSFFFLATAANNIKLWMSKKKKTGKKIWSNISRLSTNLVKKYCLRKLKENDEGKTMKTNRKNLPLFTVSLRLIANANVQVHTYMLIFKNTFVQFFFFSFLAIFYLFFTFAHFCCTKIY